MIVEANKQRFINHNNYNIEKMKNDRFVPDTIGMLSMEFRRYFLSHIDRFQEQRTINIVDVGPAHGAIGACFFLMIINDISLITAFDFLKKVKLCLIDPVGKVIDDNLKLNFPLQETIRLLHKELFDKKIIERALSDNEFKALFHACEKLFSKATGEEMEIQYLNESKNFPVFFEMFDVSICTFCLHHIHPDHKSQALKVIMDLLKPKGFFAFADEWFGEAYFERFLLGHNHMQDPIPFEFPESPEDLLQRLEQKISLIKVVYDEKEAFMLSGHKRVFEDKSKTGHFPAMEDVNKFNIWIEIKKIWKKKK